MGFNKRELDRLNRKFRNAPRAMRKHSSLALIKGSNDLVKAMKSAAPVASGTLREAIMVDRLTNGSSDPTPAARVFVNYKDDGRPRAPHAHLVEFGSAPHTIKSQSGKPLGPGGKYGDIVNHPGSKAQPFFYPVYRVYRTRIKSRLARASRNAVKELTNGA